MKSQIFLGFLVFLFLFPGNFCVYAQQDSISDSKPNLVKYSSDFKFKEGIYLKFDQVKNNDPIPKSKIISTVDYNNPQFFEAVSTESVISYYDQLGIRQEVAIKNIWGYCKNGSLYVRMSDSFNKINILGSICHFVANITIVNSRYSDPYYYNPYYYNRYYGPTPTYSSSEIRQFIMDFETGKIYDYEIDNLEVLLMRDPELHDEYAAFSKKKKQQMKFLYIRKFNDRNPLLIPNS
jgi:hypothetical protein